MHLENRFAARIMVIDDEPANVLIVTRLLERHGYTAVTGWTDPIGALEAFDHERPDLVIVDLHMPGLDGYGVMEAIDERVQEGTYLPVLVLTADATPDARSRSFRSGARDFMTKPVDADELGFRVASLLETRLLNLRLQAAVRGGQQADANPAAPVPAADVGAEVARLLRALAVVDDEPAELNARVGELAAALAAEIGAPAAFVADLRRAAELHDVGKIGVPQYLLQRRGTLSADERRQVQAHTERGAALLDAFRDDPVIALAVTVALSHHERWDGSGYPRGLSGEQIPLAGRIVAIADAYTSATRLAPEGSWAARAALGPLREAAGSAFDPALVDAFSAMLQRRFVEARAAG